MKINIKSLELIESGLSSKTVSKLTESQINILHSKLVGEQSNTGGVVQTQKMVKTTKIPASTAKTTGAKVDGITISQDGSGNIYAQEAKEEIEETKDKKDKNNPWAICTASVGRKDKKKYERCVKDVKKSLKEGKNPVSLMIEHKIMSIVETHLPPKITKSDLMKYITEQKPGVAPSKPKTNPTTKPGKPGTSPKKPAHPLRNPNPGEKPAPKAKKVSPEDAKDEVIDIIMNLLQK